MEIRVNVGGLAVDPVTNMPIVILRENAGARLLPIWVGVFEANAIALEMEHIETPRPMTHDLLKRVLDKLHARVERVVVWALKKNTFYAIIYIDAGMTEALALDARPSDAIALALRAEAPIFVEEAVLSSAREQTEDGESSLARLQNWLENIPESELGKYKM